jgi:uncharacterized phiE125 gp8 family phage protein
MGLVQYAAPAVEPVTLTEAKLHCRVDASTDDTLITSLITAARQMVEEITRRVLITQTWDLKLDDWPCAPVLEIPLPPLQSVTSVSYKDSAAATKTLASGNYTVATSGIYGRIVLLEGVSWPSVTLYAAESISVRFVAGYGLAVSVPQSIKVAILLLVGHYYENREAVLMPMGGSMVQLPIGVQSLLTPYRAVKF